VEVEVDDFVIDMDSSEPGCFMAEMSLQKICLYRGTVNGRILDTAKGDRML